jgi:hypothetical protein
MVTWGSKLKPSRLGVGQQIDPASVPREITINYTGFRSGLMLSDRPGDVPIGFYTMAQDVETNRSDIIQRSPGVTQVEVSPYDLAWLAIHPSLDFQSALIAFSAPYLGVKEEGAFIWTDEGLDAEGDAWVAAVYGDILLFSNGIKGYARNFDTKAVDEVADMPGAATLFVAFGRVFAGGTSAAIGEYNPLAMIWTGVTGDYRDWTGAGSGAELLLTDVPQGDRIVAGRIMSYDLVAVLNRRSIWIGSRTGLLANPALFQQRLVGVGCVAEPTAKTTEGGVTFLSDEGVRHFDGQEARIISGPINAELLPIDFDQINRYRSLWDGTRRRYLLTTPQGLYIYQFPTSEYPQGAWFKRTIQATNLVAFADQIADLTWDTYGERSWVDAGESWRELGTPEQSGPPRLYFISGSVLGVEDPVAVTNFGIPTNPLFTPRPNEQPAVDNPDRIFLTKRFLLEYKGSGTIEFIAVDEAGIAKLVHTEVLPVADARRIKVIDVLDSARAEGLAVRVVAGFPEIYSLKQTVLDNGPILTDLVGEHLYTETSDVLFSDIVLDGDILWE